LASFLVADPLFARDNIRLRNVLPSDVAPTSPDDLAVTLFHTLVRAQDKKNHDAQACPVPL
jgi:hypothetical protein